MLDAETANHIFSPRLIIFAFRATPSVGEGYRWFAIDVLGFDEAFYGILQQTGAAIAVLGARLLSDVITRVSGAARAPMADGAGGVLSPPTLALVFQLHRHHGAAGLAFGARSIAPHRTRKRQRRPWRNSASFRS